MSTRTVRPSTKASPSSTARVGTRVRANMLALSVAGAAALTMPGMWQAAICQPATQGVATQTLDIKLAETIDRVPVTVRLLSGQTVTADMVVTHFRPEGAGPFPAIVLNHGRTSMRRHEPARVRLLPMVRHWIRRGFAVVVPTRIGYGALGQQHDPEAMGRCSNADYRIAVESMGTQVVAAARFAGRLPHVDASRVLALGASYGGFAVIAATAHRNPGIVGAINFVGGLGGNRQNRPGQPCRGDRIAEVVRGLGQQSRVPMMWLYAENDRLWGRDWPRQWHNAFTSGGGKAEFVAFAAVGEDGHRLMSQAFALWRPVVDRYIGQLGFAVPKAQSSLPASGYARLDEIDRVPHLTPERRTQGYARFLKADVPRAFALSPSGAWSWRRGADAVRAALDNCQQRARLECRLYAVDDRVVWQEQGAGDRPARPGVR